MFLQEEAAWEQVSLGSAALREARAELAEARKQWHSLQVEIETLHAMVGDHLYEKKPTLNTTQECHSPCQKEVDMFVPSQAYKHEYVISLKSAVCP